MPSTSTPNIYSPGIQNATRVPSEASGFYESGPRRRITTPSRPLSTSARALHTPPTTGYDYKRLSSPSPAACKPMRSSPLAGPAINRNRPGLLQAFHSSSSPDLASPSSTHLLGYVSRYRPSQGGDKNPILKPPPLKLKKSGNGSRHAIPLPRPVSIVSSSASSASTSFSTRGVRSPDNTPPTSPTSSRIPCSSSLAQSTPSMRVEDCWLTASPFAGAPRFSRLGVRSASVVMPLSAREYYQRRPQHDPRTSAPPPPPPSTPSIGYNISWHRRSRSAGYEYRTIIQSPAVQRRHASEPDEVLLGGNDWPGGLSSSDYVVRPGPRKQVPSLMKSRSFSREMQVPEIGNMQAKPPRPPRIVRPPPLNLKTIWRGSPSLPPSTAPSSPSLPDLSTFSNSPVQKNCSQAQVSDCPSSCGCGESTWSQEDEEFDISDYSIVSVTEWGEIGLGLIGNPTETPPKRSLSFKNLLKRTMSRTGRSSKVD